jgi:large subunit ribosomal protein L25
MRKDITIVAEPRDTRGKNEARRLRVKGLAPAVVYGAGGEAKAIAIDPRELNKILASATGRNTLFNVQANGDTALCMIAAWQRHPLRENLLHVDFKRIDPSKPLKVRIPIYTKGEPRGVKEQGGIFEIVHREVEVECLPDEIPESFPVDVAQYMLGTSLRAGELPLTGSMKLLTAPETVMAHVIAPRTVAAAEDATAEATAATTAEPEVIKKGKKEEEAAAEKGGDKKK